MGSIRIDGAAQTGKPPIVFRGEGSTLPGPRDLASRLRRAGQEAEGLIQFTQKTGRPVQVEKRAS